MPNPEFTFVPRKLGQSSRNRGGGYSKAQDASGSTKNLKVAKNLSKSSKHDAATTLSEPTQHVVTSESSLTIPPLPLEDDRTKKGKYLDDKVYTILFELTLSDYSLWSNKGLLQMIQGDEEGFVPISYLTRTSPYFIGLGLDTIPPGSILIRSIRGSGMLEGRLKVSNGVSLRDRFGKTRRDLDVLDERDGMGLGLGLGFEVRRKDWVDMGVRDRVGRYSKFYWESRSVYVENLPYRTRSFHTIYDFIQQLLPSTLVTSDSDDSAPDLLPRIQNISFPPHHKDSPDAPVPTTGKGFAFIVLSSPKDVDYIIQRWPWEVDRIGLDLKSPAQRLKCQKSKSELVEREGGEDERDKVVREAMEYGFRCLAKRRWDEMKEEYLALQRRLLEETFAANESAPSTSNYAPPNPSIPHPHPHPNDMDEQQAPSTDSKSKSKSKSKSNTITRGIEEPSLPLPPPHFSSSSSPPPDWFPKNCLVFIKNVHPETNKTCLRTLFASAFDMDVSAIDYVDYNKGLDSCYIRLSHPTHARTLIDYFSKHPKVQKGALDSISPVAEPLPSSNKNKTSTPIIIELVQGKKEELYWEKIPVKVRKDALGRLELNKVDVEEEKEKGKGKDVSNVEDGSLRKRKRRKNGISFSSP